MKISKKKIILAALAVCLISVLSVGTLAWFNASDSVTNEFHMATSKEDPDEIFSVDVWEYVDGDTENPDNDGHIYENITPGDVLHKEPHIENTGAYAQWIRVKVTLSEGEKWLTALGNDYDMTTLFSGLDSTAWTMYDQPALDSTTGALTYVFYLNDRLEAEKDVTLFTNVNIPAQLTQEDMVFTGGKFSLDIVAEALQADNTGNTAKEAFDNCWKY